MCIICAKGVGINLPKEEHMENCNASNPDGIGIGYWKKGSNEVKIKKDFKNVKEFYEWLKINISIEDACIIHFRNATHGNVDKGNRHPFPVSTKKKDLRTLEISCNIAVAHNGIFYGYKNTGMYSDTQMFILEVLAQDIVINNISNPTIQKLLGGYLGFSKLALIFNNSSILWFGECEKYEGLWYSNTSYTHKIGGFNYGGFGYRGGYSYDNQYEENEKCDICKQAYYLYNYWKDKKHYRVCWGCKTTLENKEKLIVPIKEQTLLLPQKDNLVLIKKEKCSLCDAEHLEKELLFYRGNYLCSSCMELFRGEDGYKI